MSGHKPDYEDIVDAASRISGYAVQTPLLSVQSLDEVSAAEVFVKPECLQRTGSFKFRGAYNAISRLSDEELQGGIIASSSGNHAQGVAAASAIMGAKATIIMPNDAPRLKVERTRSHGADIRFYDRSGEDREEIAKQVMAELGGTFVHPYEHPHVIAGQGTTGLEIALELKSRGKTLDRLLVCTGGGGLTAGVAMAARYHFPNVRVHTVEPAGFDDYRRSLGAGERVSNPSGVGSICDAILTPMPGELSFDICNGLIEDGLVVTDEEALAAVRFAFNELKIVLEPGGAAALAALLQAGTKWAGETIAVITSGGNVDAEVFSRAIG